MGIVEGEAVLMKFADEYGDDTINAQDFEGLAMVGRAMYLMRAAKDANKAYNESERVANGPNARVETLEFLDRLCLRKPELACVRGSTSCDPVVLLSH